MADYYVRATGGSDGNSGTSFANGWATMQYADGLIGSGDTLFVCSDVSNKFSVTSYISIAGVSNWRGADLVDGSPYNGSGKAYIVAGLPMANMVIFSGSYHTVSDIEFDGANAATSILYIVDLYRCSYTNCNFTQAITRNVEIQGTASFSGLVILIMFNKCEFTDSGVLGVDIYDSGYAYLYTFHDCRFSDNASIGLKVQSTGTGFRTFVTVTGSRFFGNGNDGIYTYLASIELRNSILHGNGNHGISFNQDAFLINWQNNIISNNGGYGISYTGVATNLVLNMDFNCYHNNTSGNANFTLPGYHNVLADPEFVSIVPGSEDFELEVTSPCVNTGTGFEGGK